MMQQDTFIEKIVKKRKTAKDRLKIITFVILAIFLFLVVMTFAPLIGFLVPLLIVGIIYGLWFLISSQNREYEYIVTNGELDVDVIIARRRRKRLFSKRVRDFEMMAPIDSDEYRQAQKGKHTLLDCSGVIDNRDNWFILSEYKSERVLLVIEPDERMLANMKRYNPSKIKYSKFGT